MSLQSFDDFIARIGAGFYFQQPIWGESLGVPNANVCAAGTGQFQKAGDTAAMPSLPAGVTAFIPTALNLSGNQSASSILYAKAINLGSFDISNTTVGTFTAGSSMPTQTIFGVSTAMASAVWLEATTALTGTQTLMTVTYTNQSGAGSQTTTFTPTNTVGIHTAGPMPLTGSDWGVRSISAVSRAASAGPVGVFKFWGLVPLSWMNLPQQYLMTMDNFVTAGVNIQRLGAGDQFIGIRAASGQGQVTGVLYGVDDN